MHFSRTQDTVLFTLWPDSYVQTVLLYSLYLFAHSAHTHTQTTYTDCHLYSLSTRVPFENATHNINELLGILKVRRYNPIGQSLLLQTDDEQLKSFAFELVRIYRHTDQYV